MAQGVCMSEDKPTKQKKEVDLADFVQRTLVIFKPDSVQRGIVGEILQRFERVGLKIVGMKMVSPDQVLFKRHYEDIGKLISRRGEETFMYNLNYMMSGPIIAMCLEGVEAVALVRKIVGPTEPKSADMGTIRGDFSHMSFGYSNAKKIGVPNLVHASGNPEEAAEEVELWFTDAELYDYEDLNEKYTR
jgi:nucleoside diphosphate kinase